jgi:hypothetical protein
LKNPLRKICTAGSVRGETRSGLLYSEWTTRVAAAVWVRLPPVPVITSE